MEHKTFPAEMLNVDEPQGIVETVFAVFGNVDLGKDKLHPGSFTKTFQERGLKVRVLDQHRTDSVMHVVGKPLQLRELSRMELPPGLLDKHPEATGGAYAQVKLLLNTPEGAGVFERLKEGLVDEWSFGYDPITVDYSTEKGADGKETTIRNLREVRLMELSPVVWGMNPATQTISAKDIEPEEGKPWNIFQEEGRYCVYKVDEDGNKTGSSRGCHDTREEAQAQMRALYANTEEEMATEGPQDEKAVMKTEADGQHPASHYLVVEDGEKPSTWHLRVRGTDGKPDHRLMGAAWAALHGGYRGNVYQGPGKQEAIAKLRRMYSSEDMDTPKEDEGPEDMKELISRLERLEALLLKDEDHDAPPEDTGAAEDTPEDEDAGPEIPPTSERLAMLRRLEAELLEVE